MVQKKPGPQADVPVVEHEGLVWREGPGREIESYGEGVSVGDGIPGPGDPRAPQAEAAGWQLVWLVLSESLQMAPAGFLKVPRLELATEPCLRHSRWRRPPHPVEVCGHRGAGVQGRIVPTLGHVNCPSGAPLTGYKPRRRSPGYPSPLARSKKFEARVPSNLFLRLHADKGAGSWLYVF